MRRAVTSAFVCALAIVVLFMPAGQVAGEANNPPVAVLWVFDVDMVEGGRFLATGALETNPSYDPDPGDYIATYRFDWGDGTWDSESVGDPEFDGFMTHWYCDEGVYTITLTVADNHGLENVNTDTNHVDRTVENDPPHVTLTPSAGTVTEGTVVFFDATFRDGAGVFDEPYGVTWTSQMTADGVAGPDGPGSATRAGPICAAQGTLYRVTQTSFAYGDDGFFEVGLEVEDDFPASGTDSVTITSENVAPTVNIINATLFPNKPRTHGYWKHQNPCDPDTPINDEHVGIKPEYVDFIHANSRVWATATVDEMCADLENEGQGQLEQLRMQTIALWLNVAAQFLRLDTPLHHPLTNAATIGEFLIEVEDAILIGEPGGLQEIVAQINQDADGLPDPPDYLYVDPVVGIFSATASDPGSDDLTFEWKLIEPSGPTTILRTITYENDPFRGPDPGSPLWSPGGFFPVSVTDGFSISFPAIPPSCRDPTPCKIALKVTDDDGGMAVDEDILDTSWSADWDWEYAVSYQQISGGFVIAIVSVTYVDWDCVVVRFDPYTGVPIPGGCH